MHVYSIKSDNSHWNEPNADKLVHKELIQENGHVKNTFKIPKIQNSNSKFLFNLETNWEKTRVTYHNVILRHNSWNK